MESSVYCEHICNWGDLQELEETENSENADSQCKNIGKLFVIFRGTDV